MEQSEASSAGRFRNAGVCELFPIKLDDIFAGEFVYECRARKPLRP